MNANMSMGMIMATTKDTKSTKPVTPMITNMATHMGPSLHMVTATG